MKSIFSAIAFFLMLFLEPVWSMESKDVEDLGAQPITSSVVEPYEEIQGWTLSAEELQEFRERKDNLERELVGLWALKSSIEFLEDKTKTTIQRLEPGKRYLEIRKRAKMAEFKKLRRSKARQQAEYQYLTERLEEYEQGQPVEHKADQFLSERTQRNTILLSLGIDSKDLQDCPHASSLGTLASQPEGVVFLVFNYLPIETLGQCLSTSHSFNRFADKALYSNYRPFCAFLQLDFDKIAEHLPNKELLNLNQLSRAFYEEMRKPINTRKEEQERRTFPAWFDVSSVISRRRLLQDSIDFTRLQIHRASLLGSPYDYVKKSYERQRAWRREIALITSSIVWLDPTLIIYE